MANEDTNKSIFIGVSFNWRIESLFATFPLNTAVYSANKDCRNIPPTRQIPIVRELLSSVARPYEQWAADPPCIQDKIFETFRLIAFRS